MQPCGTVGGVWVVTGAVVLVAAGAGAYYLLADTAPPSSMSIQADACSGLTASTEVWPSRPPDAELDMALAKGENVSIMQGPGVWRAKLEATGASISPSLPGARGTPDDWTREFDLMWCHTRPEPKTFLSDGDGTLHVRAWQGTGEGFSASRAWS